MKFSAKTLFALIGAVLALLMFLLPFATASGYGESESVNAFSVMFDSDDAGDLCVPFFVWITFLGLLASIVTLFLGKAKISGACLAVGTITTFLYIVTFQSMSVWGVSVHVGVGAWLSMIFSLVGAVFALFGDKFPFLKQVKVDQVTSKLDSASAAFQKTAGSVASTVKTGVQAGVQAAAAKAAAKEKTCPQCGVKIDAESKFCPSCGAPIPQDEQPAQEETPAGHVCPSCGAALGADSKFCPGCGAQV